MNQQILDAITRIVEGSSVDEQLNLIIEANKEVPPLPSESSWWPPKNSRFGEPKNIAFWEMVLDALLRGKKKWPNVDYDEVIERIAQDLNIKPREIHEFLNATGLDGAFKGCTLDAQMTKKVIDDGKRGGGIWTKGTADTMLQRRYSGRTPRVDPTKGRLNLRWRAPQQKKDDESTGRFNRPINNKP